MGWRVTAYGPVVRKRRSPATAGPTVHEIPIVTRAHTANALDAMSTTIPNRRTTEESVASGCPTPRPKISTTEQARTDATINGSGVDWPRIRPRGARSAVYTAPPSQTTAIVHQHATRVAAAKTSIASMAGR